MDIIGTGISTDSKDYFVVRKIDVYAYGVTGFLILLLLFFVLRKKL